ncbi:MAG: winged helix-turn-helix domain-containing protein [Xanthomonadales bacterium]|nr:winged helix-turn-helix domain-containing protein [Xanthomonadales bacterium]
MRQITDIAEMISVKLISLNAMINPLKLTSEQTNKLYFLDYHLDLNTRQLFHGDTPLAITHLGFEVLLFLMQHQGQVVSRDQLADHAWKNKVITDATLYKQIQRLRKLLNQAGDAENLIQTVHGQGFIFKPEVSLQPPQNDVFKRTNNRLVSYVLLALVIITVFFVSWSLMTNSKDTQPMINIDAIAKPLVLSVLPNIEQLNQADQAWMASGGMSYLIEMFSGNQAIKVKHLSKTQMLTAEAEKNAISLTHNREIDVALVFDVTENNNQFRAHAVLRNADRQLAEQQFQSIAVKELFDQMYQWVNNQLEVDTSRWTSNQTLSDDRYAIENYIRGMGAQFSGKAAEAIQYFELATKEDPKFWKAWYELAIAYRKQGQHDQALAIAETLLQTVQAEPLHLGTLNAKALALWRLGKHQKALQTLDEVISLAESKQYTQIHYFFTNKAIIATELGDLVLAEQAISQSINLLQNQDTINHRSLGSAYNTLAGINHDNGNFEQAKIHALKAVVEFEQAGEFRYQLTAQSRLAGLYLELGELELAEQLTSSLLIEQKMLGDVSGQISNWLKIADINLLTGQMKEVKIALDQIAVLLTETSNEYLSNQYLVAKIKYHQQTDQWQQIPPLLDQLEQMIINDSQQLTYHDLSLAYQFYSGDTEAFEQAIKAVSTDLQDHAIIDYWRAMDALSKQQQAKALSAMQNARQKVMQSPHNRVLRIRILNHLAVLLLAEDPMEAALVIEQAAILNPPAYPFLKIKAQVEATQNNYFAAASLMQELKAKAHDLWSPEDQLQLEDYQRRLNQ